MSQYNARHQPDFFDVFIHIFSILDVLLDTKIVHFPSVFVEQMLVALAQYVITPRTHNDLRRAGNLSFVLKLSALVVHNR